MTEHSDQRTTAPAGPTGSGATPQTLYDVAVIGAGIVGAAIARHLAERQISVALLESRDEVGEGTSKANTAILHTGFDAKPGTLESDMVSRGYHLLGEYAERTGIPVERVGAILVAWDLEQLEALPGLAERARQNGYQDARIISAADVYAQLPDIGPGALGGMKVPGESIICTWTTNTALATEAVRRGVDLLLGSAVREVAVGTEHTELRTGRGTVRARWVINCAGLSSDLVDRMFGHARFTITARRGELVVFDKQSRPLAPKIMLPVPSKMGKGVLISPTVYGNVMLGPTAEDLGDRTDSGTTEGGFRFLWDKGSRLMPQLLEEEVSATYAGLRAASDQSDYVVDLDATQRYVVAGGIRSTGLTSGMALAEHIESLMDEAEALPAGRREDLPPAPQMACIGDTDLRPYQDAARIEADPEYGRIICFCERVSAGEIRDALTAEVPATTLEGLRRRTRAQNGRCQGFYCGAEIAEMLETHTRTDVKGTVTR